MKKFRRKKTNLKLIIFLIVLLCTSLGYAIYTQELVINGTVSGSANFKVYFIDAWVENSSKGTTTINANADKVTYTANLSYPGDKVLIGTKIKNESSVPVKLNDFLITKSNENSDIKISYISLDSNTEILQENEICDYEFIVEWDGNSSNENPEALTCEITLDYEQYTEIPKLETQHIHNEESVEKELQDETIEILGNDDLKNDYTIYLNEIREFKALVKKVYTDGKEEIETNKTITWTVTNGTGSVEQQGQANILRGIQTGTVTLKAEFEKIDGTTGTDEKTIKVINWQESNGTITNGELTLKIGDYIAYDNTTNYNGQLNQTYTATATKTGTTSDATYSASGYTGGWRVLGFSDGKIQLISAEPVGNLILKGQNGYINGIDEMNAISAIYAHGKGADFGRSVNVNDVNNITGYNPMLTGTGEVRAKGMMWEYGNIVTYFWKNNKVNCTASNGLSHSSSYTVYKYYDKENKVFVDLPKDQTIDIKSSSYNYYPTTLTESSSGTVKGIATTRIEYKLLFSSKYWLASSFIGTGESNTGYGIFQLDTNRVYDSNLYEAKNGSNSLTLGVRPVITMSSFLRVIKNSDNDGSTQAKACIIK